MPGRLPPSCSTSTIPAMSCTAISSYRCSTATMASGWSALAAQLLRIQVYDTATVRPVAVLLRSGKTPSGEEIRGHLRRLVRRIRRHWPTTRLTIRGDSHYGRPEVMAWCEANGLDYIFGLSGNAVLDRRGEAVADAGRGGRGPAHGSARGCFTEPPHRAR